MSDRPAPTEPDPVERGRDAFGRRAWGEAWGELDRADRHTPLEVEDLERLATAAYLIGREADFHDCLERAHHAHVTNSEPSRAALRILARNDAAAPRRNWAVERLARTHGASRR